MLPGNPAAFFLPPPSPLLEEGVRGRLNLQNFYILGCVSLSRVEGCLVMMLMSKAKTGQKIISLIKNHN